MYIPYVYYIYIIHIQTLHLSLVYTMYIPCIYHSYTCTPSLISIYHVYTMYIHNISLSNHLILHEPLHCRVSWHLSTHGTAQSRHGGQQARCS